MVIGFSSVFVSLVNWLIALNGFLVIRIILFVAGSRLIVAPPVARLCDNRIHEDVAVD